MDKFKFNLCLKLAKFTSRCLKLANKSGTSLPGVLVLKMYPDFLKNINPYVKKDIITITGTNGKTTTSNLISSIISQKNIVINNSLGANMLSGIITAICIGLDKKKYVDYLVLESDEAYLTKVYDSINSDFLLVTNLFRDQLDRYGELDTTRLKIDAAIKKNPNLTLFLNADDPMVALMRENNNKIKFFGFENIKFENDFNLSNSPSESVKCICGKELNYHQKFYAHLGNYYCNCSYKRPDLDFRASCVIYKDKIEINVNGFEFKSNLSGCYNAYNLLGAISMCLELKITPIDIQMALDKYKSVFGRSEKYYIKNRYKKNKNVLINLIKNPVGATEVINSFTGYENSNLMLILNDNYADGRDVSWIWDVDFEVLKNFNNKIIISGKRAWDMALRLKYAYVNLDNIIVEKNIKKALKYSLNLQNNDNLTILPTYTALLDLKKLFRKYKVL